MKKSISPKTPKNAPWRPKTPNFDYNISEMKKSISPKPPNKVYQGFSVFNSLQEYAGRRQF